MRALITCMLLLLAWPGVAGTAEDEAALRGLLDKFLAGATANDRAVHQRFWSEDLVYTSAAGMRFGKAEIMAGLDEAEPDPDGPVYTADQVQVRVLGETAVITFRLVATDAAGEATYFFNTGVFRRREDTWQAFTWQATRAPENNKPLLVWSYRGGAVIEPLLDAFREQTGLAVEYRVLGGDSIVEALLEDGLEVPDLVLVVDALRLDTLKQAGKLRPLPEAAIADIDPKWRDAEGYWTGISWRARSVVRRADDTRATDADALPELARAGEFCVREGAHVYNRGWLAWLAANAGEPAATEWAETVFTHRVDVDGGDRDQIRAVADGRCSVALVNHYYLMRWAVSDDSEQQAITEGLVFGWPDPATPVAVNVSGIALPAGSRQTEAADRLATWMAGPEAQAIYAASVFEFPLGWPAEYHPLAPGLRELTLTPGPPWPASLPTYREAAESFFEP